MDYTHAAVAFHQQQSLNTTPVQHQAHQQQDRRQSHQRRGTLMLAGDDDSTTVTHSGTKGPGVMGDLNGGLRRDSTTTGSGNDILLSNEHQHHTWDPQQYGAGLPNDSRLAANPSSQYFDDSHTFMTPSVSQQSTFAQPTLHQQWATTSGAVVPGFNAEYMPHGEHFGHDTYAGTITTADVAWADHSLGHAESSQPVASVVQANYMTTPLVSYSTTDHMALADHDVRHRRNSRRLHSRTPQRTVPEARQGDGVRKKNGRIDIPAGRNINNIDMLIETAEDDALVVELKSQKRLLRNREAALTSRQRKKQYTEELEHREKIANARLAAYELALARFEGIEQVLKASQEHVTTLQQEKKDLIDQHEHEIAELRLSIQALEERVEAGPAPSMSAVPSSTGFTELNESVAAMNFAISEHPADQGWHDFIQIDGIADDFQGSSYADGQHQIEPQRELEPKASIATLVPNAQGKSDVAAGQPVASSLLFMILLCGALFASKPASSQMAGMPAVPEMLRSAASDILQVLLESDLSGSHGQFGSAREMLSPDDVRMSAPQSIPVDQIYGDVATSFQQQGMEQSFGLGSMQYESLTNQDYAEDDSDYHVGRRSRNLAQALLELQRKHSLGSKADVFVRSLLWDQIPEHVVQEFKQMIRQHQAGPNLPKQHFQFPAAERLNSMYKAES